MKKRILSLAVAITIIATMFTGMSEIFAAHLLSQLTPITADSITKRVESIAFYGNYMYVGCWEGNAADNSVPGIKIIDIADINNPVDKTPTLEVNPGLYANRNATDGKENMASDTSRNVYVKDGKLYGLFWKEPSGGSDRQDFIRIYDIEDNPENPSLISEVRLTTRPRGIYVKDNHVYVATSGVERFDLNNIPTAADAPVGKGKAAFSMDGNENAIVFGCEGGEIGIVDISTPEAPIYKGIVNTGINRTINDIKVKGNYAYFVIRSTDTNTTDGVVGVLDLSDISDIENLSIKTYQFGMKRVNGLSFYQDLIYAVELDKGISVIDAKDPLNLRLICRDDRISGSRYTISVKDGKIYACSRNDRVDVYDMKIVDAFIDSPANGERITTLPFTIQGHAYGVSTVRVSIADTNIDQVVNVLSDGRFSLIVDDDSLTSGEKIISVSCSDGTISESISSTFILDLTEGISCNNIRITKDGVPATEVSAGTYNVIAEVTNSSTEDIEDVAFIVAGYKDGKIITKTIDKKTVFAKEESSIFSQSLTINEEVTGIAAYIIYKNADGNYVVANSHIKLGDLAFGLPAPTIANTNEMTANIIINYEEAEITLEGARAGSRDCIYTFLVFKNDDNSYENLDNILIATGGLEGNSAVSYTVSPVSVNEQYILNIGLNDIVSWTFIKKPFNLYTESAINDAISLLNNAYTTAEVESILMIYSDMFNISLGSGSIYSGLGEKYKQNVLSGMQENNYTRLAAIKNDFERLVAEQKAAEEEETLPAITQIPSPDASLQIWATAVKDGYLYAIAGVNNTEVVSPGLRVYDVTSKVRYYDLTPDSEDFKYAVGESNAIKVIDGKLYTISWEKPAVLRIYSLTNPAAPVLLHSYANDKSGTVKDFIVDNHYVYMVGNGGISKLDLTNKETEKIESGDFLSIAQKGNYIFTGDRNGNLKVYEKNENGNLTAIWSKHYDDPVDSTKNVHIQSIIIIGDYLYFARRYSTQKDGRFYGEIGIFDISNPSEMDKAKEGFYTHSSPSDRGGFYQRRISALATDGRHIYVADVDSRHYVLDTYNPFDLEPIFGTPKGGIGGSYGVSFYNNRGFLAQRSGGIRIFNYPESVYEGREYSFYGNVFATVDEGLPRKTDASSIIDHDMVKITNPGEGMTYNFYSYVQGTKKLSFNYILVTGTTTANIIVNGTTYPIEVQNDGWNYQTSSTINIPLLEGDNTIRIEGTGNVDNFYIEGINISKEYVDSKSIAVSDIKITGVDSEHLVPGTSGAATVKVMKQDDSKPLHTSMLIVAFYSDNNELISVDTTKQALNDVSDKAVLTNNFIVPNEAKKLKVFVWSDLHNLIPLK